ncbi:MAG: ANTAR domain-containing protein [Lachnospiraceae bacterium]|nr:ANTAR domain-containing protein [Lachnospiraceae bacterium]
MATPIQTYSVLLVSAARKINTALMSFLPGERFDPVTVVDTAARARRTMAERDYDFIIINGPLPDEFGRKLAIDLSGESGRVVLLLVRSDVYEEICIAMTPHGILVARRPMDTAMLGQLLNIMCSVRERLRGFTKKNLTLEEKMEEIRLVNKTKWALIESCHMTEEGAHRYIQKQAMDQCIGKRDVAKNILKIYG